MARFRRPRPQSPIGAIHPNRALAVFFAQPSAHIRPCLGLNEFAAKQSDLVDQLPDHRCPHRFLTPEPVTVVEQGEPLLDQPTRVCHDSNIRS